MKSFAWYLKEYGEDWASIVYEEDLRRYQEGVEFHEAMNKVWLQRYRPASWISDGINE